MKIVCISDTHNKLDRVSVPDGDVLIHAGDATMQGTEREIIKFNTDIGKLPHPHKIFVPGNHDWLFERHPGTAKKLLTNAKTLIDEGIKIDGLFYYGSPWQPKFNNWAFNLDRGEPLARKWAGVPNNTDVLITHAPPYGYCDFVLGGGRVGCVDLLMRIKEVKPTVSVFGHIHEAAGTSQNEHTTFINASVLDDVYLLANEPVVMDL